MANEQPTTIQQVRQDLSQHLQTYVDRLQVCINQMNGTIEGLAKPSRLEVYQHSHTFEDAPHKIAVQHQASPELIHDSGELVGQIEAAVGEVEEATKEMYTVAFSHF